MKKFFEYVCVCSAVLGTLVIIGAVGSIETDRCYKVVQWHY